MAAGDRELEARDGIIGIGLLGSAIAGRILAAGLPLAGFDPDEICARRFSTLGGQPAGSAEEIARSCGRIVLSLPNSATADRVIGGIAPLLHRGAIVIDTTTGDPDQMAAMGARLGGQGVRYIDATVGGSSTQTQAGDVIVLAGGEAAAMADCADLFSCFAKRVFHLGPCGAGARMKLVLNLVLGLNRAVLAEGLAFAGACGIDPEVALDVLIAGPAFSRVMETKGRKMLARDFTAEARLSQHLKDVRLILEQGGQHGARLPLSSLHRELLESLDAAGLGLLDNSAVIEAFRKQDGE